MNVQFYDHEVPDNPHNGAIFSDARDVLSLLDESRSRTPSFYELTGNNNYKLLVGIGSDIGCVQYSASDGAPPYLMAVNRSMASSDEEYEEFLADGTLTPVKRRYCLPIDVVRRIVAEFVESGHASSSIDWEEI